jgi:hypothetical protein
MARKGRVQGPRPPAQCSGGSMLLGSRLVMLQPSQRPQCCHVRLLGATEPSAHVKLGQVAPSATCGSAVAAWPRLGSWVVAGDTDAVHWLWRKWVHAAQVTARSRQPSFGRTS